MKTFKEFKSEQQHISEIGPVGTAIAGAMGLVGLGIAGYKLFNKAKEGIKGYRETKADKKARKENGFTMSVKVYNPETERDMLDVLKGIERALLSISNKLNK